MNSQPHRRRGVLLLTVATFLWGTTFVVTKQSLIGFSAGDLVLGRFLIAAILFVPFLRRGWKLWRAAIELGVWLWLGFAAQTLGLRYTTVDRSAFLTSMHVIFVPAFAGLLGRRSSLAVWLAAAIALGGVGLLSNDGSPPNLGDAWTLGCAIFFAIYITRLETLTAKFPSMPLTAAHLWIVAILSSLWAIAARAPVHHIPWAGILYLAIAATAATTWLQTAGQKYVSAPQAAVLYMLEPVWGVFFAWIYLGERLGISGWIGASMILAAASLTQLPTNRNQRSIPDLTAK